MEVNPVKEAKLPKYPRMDEVSTESIKEALPRRWSANRAAKTALAALAVPTLTDIAISPDGREFVMETLSPMPEETDGQLTEVTTLDVEPLSGVPMPPPVWPYLIAAGFVIGLAVYFNIRKRKRLIKETDKENTETETESEEYDEGEY